MKKVLSILAIVMLLSMSVVAFAAENQESNDILSEYNIVFYETDASIENNGNTPNIIVLTEQQLLQLGNQAKQLFENASILYVLTDMSISEIKDVCDMSSSLSSDEVQELKFATAIMKDDNGNYVFSDVSALYADAPTSNKTRSISEIPESQKVYDGLYSVLKTTEKELNATSGLGARMQASDFDAFSTDSAVVYDSSGNRIGTMGYTTYWYKIVKSGSHRIFDVITVATFAPDTGYFCKKMSVYLGTSQANHEVLEAANIVSNNQTSTHSLSLSASKTGVSGGGSTSWSYTIDAQTVTKSFDMTSNDRTWTFQPVSPGDGDAWIEEPGIRMYSSQERCYTKVTLSCPFVTIFGIELSENTLSKNWYMDY